MAHLAVKKDLFRTRVGNDRRRFVGALWHTPKEDESVKVKPHLSLRSVGHDPALRNQKKMVK